MSGIGTRYHPLKAKSTLIIFFVFAFLGYGINYLPVPSTIGLLTMPLDLLHSFTIGRLLGLLPVSLGLVTVYAPLVTYYLVSVAIGYLVHSQTSSTI